MAGVPDSTRVRSPAGMAVSLTEIDVGIPLAPSSRTERDPGTVSSDARSWVMSGLTDRNAERAREALTYAWRRMAVWRSFRTNWRAVK